MPIYEDRNINELPVSNDFYKSKVVGIVDGNAVGIENLRVANAVDTSCLNLVFVGRDGDLEALVDGKSSPIIKVGRGDRVSIKCGNVGWSSDKNKYGRFWVSAFYADGNKKGDIVQPVSDSASVKPEYIIDIPNDVFAIRISCKANTGTEVNFGVSKIGCYDQLRKEKDSYFDLNFELGSLDGKVGKPYAVSSETRFRTALNTSVFLRAGDKICCEDYANQRVFVFCVSEFGVIKSTSGWMTEDYEVTSDGYYEFIVDVGKKYDGMFNAVFFKIGGFVRRSVHQLSLFDNGISDEESILGLNFEFGSLDGKVGSKPFAVSSETRFRTALNTSVFLRAGDKICCEDYANQRVFVFGVSISGVIKSASGWNTEDYEVPSDGYYEFIVEVGRKYTNMFNAVFFRIGGEKRKTLQQLSINVGDGLNCVKPISMYVNCSDSVFGVNHRGYNSKAPENTLPAFRKSASKGFKFVETDVRTTADGELVCIHDSTVDRTSNGSGSVASKTLAELKALDFGSWFSPDFSGTEIPTFKEFLKCCKKLGLCAVVEIKDVSDFEKFFNEIIENSMVGNVMVIEVGKGSAAQYAYSNSIYVPCGSLTSTWSVSGGKSSNVGVNMSVLWRKLGFPAFTVNNYDTTTEAMINFCKENKLPMGVCTPDHAQDVLSLDPYIFLITSDVVNAPEILKENEINL